MRQLQLVFDICVAELELELGDSLLELHVLSLQSLLLFLLLVKSGFQVCQEFVGLIGFFLGRFLLGLEAMTGSAVDTLTFVRLLTTDHVHLKHVVHVQVLS